MFLVIAGHQRSGTTLLRLICNGHPDMVVTNEFRNIIALGKPLRCIYAASASQMVEHKKEKGCTLIFATYRWATFLFTQPQLCGTLFTQDE